MKDPKLLTTAGGKGAIKLFTLDMASLIPAIDPGKFEIVAQRSDDNNVGVGDSG